VSVDVNPVDQPRTDADDFQVRRAAGAQQVLKSRQIPRPIRGAIARTHDEGACLVFVEVRRHAEIGDQLFPIVRGPLLVGVDEVRRRVRRATIAECRRARSIVGVDHRILRRDVCDADEDRREKNHGETPACHRTPHGTGRRRCYLPSDRVTAVIALVAFGQPA
jgi:hypothetical protein